MQSCELELLRQEGISPQLCIPPLISSPHSPPRPSPPRRLSSLPPTISEAMDATSELSSPSWPSTPTLPPQRPSTPPATTASQPERPALLPLRPASLPLRQASPPPRTVSPLLVCMEPMPSPVPQFRAPPTPPTISMLPTSWRKVLCRTCHKCSGQKMPDS
jgi:hypothetical protein